MQIPGYDDSVGLPTMSPELQRYLEAVEKPPLIQDYHPTKKRRALGAIAAGLGGFRDPRFGREVGESVTYGPYNRQVQDYMAKTQGLGQAIGMRSQEELRKMQISGLGARALADAARRQREEEYARHLQRIDSPEYLKQRYGKPTASIGAGGLYLPESGEVIPPATRPGTARGISGPTIMMPDGTLRRNPYYVPPFHRSMSDLKELEEFKAGLKGGGEPKVADKDRARQLAIQKVMAENPEFKKYIGAAGQKLLLSAPETHWYNPRTWWSGGSEEELNKFNALVEAETQKALGGQKFTLQDEGEDDEYELEEVE